MTEVILVVYVSGKPDKIIESNFNISENGSTVG